MDANNHPSASTFESERWYIIISVHFPVAPNEVVPDESISCSVSNVTNVYLVYYAIFFECKKEIQAQTQI